MTTKNVEVEKQKKYNVETEFIDPETGEKLNPFSPLDNIRINARGKVFVTDCETGETYLESLPEGLKT